MSAAGRYRDDSHRDDSDRGRSRAYVSDQDVDDPGFKCASNRLQLARSPRYGNGPGNPAELIERHPDHAFTQTVTDRTYFNVNEPEAHVTYTSCRSQPFEIRR